MAIEGRSKPRARTRTGRRVATKPLDERDRHIAEAITLRKLADFVPIGAPEVFLAAVQNLDELTVASLNNKRQFEGKFYAEPRYSDAIKSQETAMRLFRLLGPESIKGDQMNTEPTPELLAEARRVLTARGWKEPGGKDG